MTTPSPKKAKKITWAINRRVEDSGILILTNSDKSGHIIAQKIGSLPTPLSDESTTVVSISQGLEHLRNVHLKLIILDAEEPGIDPLHWIKQVHTVQPETPVMIITTTCDPMLASRALRAGALAYLCSDEVNTLLGEAITKVAASERFVSENVMQGILHGIVETVHSESNLPVQLLSDREMMVFQLLGTGKAIRTIAGELGVNTKTVSTHCNNIRRKLQTPDNQHLAKISREWVVGRRESGKQLSTSTM